MSDAVQHILRLPKAERLRIAMEMLQSMEAEDASFPDWQLQRAREAQQQADTEPESIFTEVAFWHSIDEKIKAISER